MRKAVFEFQFLTPAILGGANQQKAEMRIPSLRGALRWWTRLLFGEKYEKETFGSVTEGKCVSSNVILRLIKSNGKVLESQSCKDLTSDPYDYFLWPFRKENVRGILQAGSTYKVSISLRQGVDEIDDGILKSFLLYGALGSRSRRAYGAVWPTEVMIDDQTWHIPENEEELLDESDNFFRDAEITIYRLSDGEKHYGDAVRECSKILKKLRCGKTQYGFSASEWGKKDHDTGLNLNNGASIYRTALGLPLKQQYTKGDVVEYSIQDWDRFASPLHFKVIRLKGLFVPILLVIPKYAPNDNSRMLAKKKNGQKFYVQFSRDLLDKLMDDPNVLPDKNFEQIACYPCVEE